MQRAAQRELNVAVNDAVDVVVELDVTSASGKERPQKNRERGLSLVGVDDIFENLTIK